MIFFNDKLTSAKKAVSGKANYTNLSKTNNYNLFSKSKLLNICEIML